MPVFTHQLGVLDGGLVDASSGQDFASPQETAFVPGALPGITAYIYGKRDRSFRALTTEFSEKARGGDWALTEFNPGKDWQGTREDLATFTHNTVSFLAGRNISLIALLAWESNSLDAGIKGSGVDDGIKRFLKEGPK